MTTGYERIKDAFLSGWAAADDTAWGREQAAQAYLDALPPASEPCTICGGTWRVDCEDGRHSSPCPACNPSPTTAEPRGCPTVGADAAEFAGPVVLRAFDAGNDALKKRRRPAVPSGDMMAIAREILRALSRPADGAAS